jgi:hypothetical protein
VGALGKIELVDLRSVWSSEALDFTPWLAEAENIALLGNALRLKLRVTAQEKRVGRFSADIVCQDIVTDSSVLIENQLERSDHGHLGQLLTYAAGLELEAATVVWIAPSFCDEHRKALRWLNGITDEKFRFFGVTLELLRISGSPPAPRFTVALAPNNWSRSVRKATAQVPKRQSAGAARRLEYWQIFIAGLQLGDDRVRVPAPNTLGNLRFDLRGRALWITVYNAASLGRVGVFIRGSDDFRKLLFSRRDDIDAQLGKEATWHDGEQWTIAVSLDADPTNRADWRRQHAWLRTRLQAFIHVFLPYAARIPKQTRGSAGE